MGEPRGGLAGSAPLPWPRPPAHPERGRAGCLGNQSNTGVARLRRPGGGACGTGSSTGTWDYFSPREQQDYLEVLAWIREQPWCDGHDVELPE
ncbi:CocE/NonD family hydrolase [Nocardia arthritidis]|uniref:CocE/NonD family hydrolase n=1 Tax=Nocardia arthritidis TaxID=228602 RepID=UPI003D161CCA